MPHIKMDFAKGGIKPDTKSIKVPAPTTSSGPEIDLYIDSKGNVRRK